LARKLKWRCERFCRKNRQWENPIDLLGDALEDRYKKVLQIIDKDPEIGAIIILLTLKTKRRWKRLRA